MLGRVLFAGGTGFIGHTLVRHLLDSGFGVRILSRRPEHTLASAPPGSEVIFGDVTRPDTLPDAFDGCRYLGIALSGQTDPARFFAIEDDGVTNLANAAEAAGIERIAMVSAAGIRNDRDEYFVRAKFLGECTLLDHSIPAAIFRTSWVMESLSRMVAGPVAIIPGPQPHPVHFIALTDLVTMISRSFTMNPAPSGIFYAYGPETMTAGQALRRYCSYLTPRRLVMHVPLAAISAGASIAGDRARYLNDLLRYLNDVPEPANPGDETMNLFGVGQTTLDQWLIDNHRR